MIGFISFSGVCIFVVTILYMNLRGCLLPLGVTSDRLGERPVVLGDSGSISCVHPQIDSCLNIVRERETPPRFAQHGTFEYEYSQRWKSLDEMEKQQREQVEKNMKDAKDKLESEMEDAYHEHQANLLRQGKRLNFADRIKCFLNLLGPH